jgi:epoxyqueuosine reductase
VSNTAWIDERAKALGFSLCGVVRAAKFPELARTQEWLARGYAGEMKYLADGRRSNPESVMPGIRSVIVCALNYNTDRPRSIEAGLGAVAAGNAAPRGWISRYAWGNDYHDVLRTKLDALVVALRERFVEGPFEARIYADTGPVQERIFAKYAGLGWLGKNTLLLNQEKGSWFFLGAILTTLDLTPTLADADAPPPDLCGSCSRCIEACPTDALVEPYVMDARRCISYLTIELRGSIPENLRAPVGRHVFGCDICQDVCPWNRRAPITREPDFEPRRLSAPANITDPQHGYAKCEEDSLYFPNLEWLASLTEEDFRKQFRGSPIKRTKWRGLARNACIALGNSDVQRGTATHGRVVELLERLAASPEPSVSESALWAISRIQ